VDRVSQVFRFAGPIEPAPEASPGWLVGSGRVKRRLKTVIDLDELITEQDFQQLTAAVRLPV
jgi:hypothetical protein